MNEVDRAAYQRRYAQRLATYGYDPKTLGWDSGKQHERFEVLTLFVPLSAVHSVLDVGCGFGDLFGFLAARGYEGRYVGLDFVPELIAAGRRVYPEADLRCGDFADHAEEGGYDLVVASGIFNAKLSRESNADHIARTVPKMFSACKIAAAADFLTSYVDFRREDLFYTPPEDVFRLAKTLTRRVALRHDYMPFEFAVCLLKDDRLAPGTRFFPIGGYAGVRAGTGPFFGQTT